MEGDCPVAAAGPRGKWLQQLSHFNSESDDAIRAALKAFISSPRPKLPETALRDGLIVPGFDVAAYWKQHAITNEPFALAQSYPGHPFCEDAMRYLPEFGGLLHGQLAPCDVDSVRQIVAATSAFLARVEQLTIAASSQSSALTETACTQKDGDTANLRRDWCHPAGIPNPREFPHGPVTGNQTDLSEAYFGDGKRDRRRLQSLARAGVVWIRGRGHRLEMFFPDYIVFERCRNQMPKVGKSSKNRQKRTQNKEKFAPSHAKQQH